MTASSSSTAALSTASSAKAGATFISPFVGRLDDIGQDGMELIADIIQIYSSYSALKTEVLVASVRHPVHVIAAAKMGADVATLPPAILKQMYNHPLTDKGLSAFLADWAKTGQSIL
jgi:transaldolase